MLMPQMIDALNRHSVAAIQQLERHAAQINQLQPLLETMNAAATDFAPMAGGGFAMRIAAPPTGMSTAQSWKRCCTITTSPRH